jgi:hypothetical protein
MDGPDPVARTAAVHFNRFACGKDFYGGGISFKGLNPIAVNAGPNAPERSRDVGPQACR